MRRILTLIALVVLGGCAKQGDRTDQHPELVEPCAGTRTDRGDGTTTVACPDGTKLLVCTGDDCSGMTDLILEGTDLTRVILATYTSGGAVKIWNNASLTHVSLPALAVVRTVSVAGNDALTDLGWPALKVAGTVNIVSNAALRTLSLPALTTGTVAIDLNSALTALDLPALLRGTLYLQENTALTTVDLPSLMVADGLYSLHNGSLSDLRLPVLSTGSLYIFHDGLTTLSLPSLKTVPKSLVCDTMWCTGGLAILNNPSLTRVDLPALVQAGSLVVEDNPILFGLTAPSLAVSSVVEECSASAAPGAERRGASPMLTWDYEGLRIARNGALTGLSLPELSAASDAIIEGNTSLASVSLPSLTQVERSFVFKDNVAYPQCAAEALLAQLSPPPAVVEISGNDTEGTCR